MIQTGRLVKVKHPGNKRDYYIVNTCQVTGLINSAGALTVHFYMHLIKISPIYLYFQFQPEKTSQVCVFLLHRYTVTNVIFLERQNSCSCLPINFIAKHSNVVNCTQIQRQTLLSEFQRDIFHSTSKCSGKACHQAFCCFSIQR